MSQGTSGVTGQALQMESTYRNGVTPGCCKCVVITLAPVGCVIPTYDKGILPHMLTQCVGNLGDCFGKRCLVF